MVLIDFGSPVKMLQRMLNIVDSRYLDFGYLEQPLISKKKNWSLFKYRNLKSGNKILWIRGEIAPQEQFLPFPTIFSIYILIKGVYLHIHLLNLVVRFVFSSILKI